MVVLVIQTALLVAIAFVAGCMVGWALRRALGSGGRKEHKPTAVQETVKPAPATAPVSPSPEKPPEKPVVTAPTPQAKGQVKERPKSEKQPETPTIPELSAASQAASQGEEDDLKRIQGIGVQNEKRLKSMSIRRFAQIATWSKKDQQTYGEALAFPGRIEREDWVGQARVLADSAKGSTERVDKETSKTTKVSASSGIGKRPKNLMANPREGGADQLGQIEGVGPAIEKKLYKLGVHHFDQIAVMSADELKWLGTAVGFPGRAEREDWQGKAKALASGGAAPPLITPKRGEIKSR